MPFRLISPFCVSDSSLSLVFFSQFALSRTQPLSLTHSLNDTMIRLYVFFSAILVQSEQNSTQKCWGFCVCWTYQKTIVCLVCLASYLDYDERRRESWEAGSLLSGDWMLDIAFFCWEPGVGSVLLTCVGVYEKWQSQIVYKTTDEDGETLSASDCVSSAFYPNRAHRRNKLLLLYVFVYSSSVSPPLSTTHPPTRRCATSWHIMSHRHSSRQNWLTLKDLLRRNYL